MRSTRSAKRVSIPSESSDDDEPLQRKKMPPKKKIKPQKNNEDSSSSESDIENYLKPADKIDLSSTFFNTEKKESLDEIEKNIFAGVNRLSDSESEIEDTEELNDIKIAKSAVEDLDVPSTSQSQGATKLNFQQLHDYTRKIEEAKRYVAMYEAKKQNEDNNLDISNILALGETKNACSSKELQNSFHSSDFESCSGSEKEDWEEVKGNEVNESKVRKEGLQITLELPNTMRKKKGVDLLTAMKRRLNRILKENQVYIHKVHLLCWLAHGNYINTILGSQTILGLALSLLPSQQCYPSNRVDLTYLEGLVHWYRKAIPLLENNLDEVLTVELLKTQINEKTACNKKILVYIFICILRSLGIHCRLVLSFQLEPLKPPANKLHSLSTKAQNENEKTKKTTDDKSKVTEKKELKTTNSNSPHPKSKTKLDEKEEKSKEHKTKPLVVSKTEGSKVKIVKEEKKRKSSDIDSIKIEKKALRESSSRSNRSSNSKPKNESSRSSHSKSQDRSSESNRSSLSKSKDKSTGSSRSSRSKSDKGKSDNSSKNEKSHSKKITDLKESTKDINKNLENIKREDKRENLNVKKSKSQSSSSSRPKSNRNKSPNEKVDDKLELPKEKKERKKSKSPVGGPPSKPKLLKIKIPLKTKDKSKETASGDIPQVDGIFDESFLDSEESKLEYYESMSEGCEMEDYESTFDESDHYETMSDSCDSDIDNIFYNQVNFKKEYFTLLQLDGSNDNNFQGATSSKSEKPNIMKLKKVDLNPCSERNHPKRLKSLPTYKEVESDEDFETKSPAKHNDNLCQSDKLNGKSSKNAKEVNLKNLGKIRSKSISIPASKSISIPASKSKLTPAKKSTSITSSKNSSTSSRKRTSTSAGESSNFFVSSAGRKQLDVRSDILNLVKSRYLEEKEATRNKLVKRARNIDYDEDYIPESSTRKVDSEEEFHENPKKQKTKVKQRIVWKEERERRVLSSDSEDGGGKSKKRQGVDIWAEVFVEAEEKWISVDVIKGQLHCINEIHNRATQPVSYIIAWDNNNFLKDISKRYCQNWNTVTRKLRIDEKWWNNTLKPFMGSKTSRDKEEDEDLARQQLEKPLPTIISEYKNHPLYVLRRHILKFEAIYPPEPVILGFVRKEPVYSRDCVYTLHSREIWLKHAKVVKEGEKPYKIVKARPKYDRLSNTVITDLLLEIFGPWQVKDYDPPTAENGIVPRNAYGNVELFKECMLPKKTVHLQLPGLNKVAKKMNIDCAPAVTGFDFHSGFSHPTFDGFVVCEEFSEVLIAAWYLEQEESEKRATEKIEKRVYGNWRRLIKGLLIRERLKARYDFGNINQDGESSQQNSKSKGSKIVCRKRRICSDESSDED